MRRSKLEDKIRIVLEDFIDSDYIKVAVRKLRSKYGIPQGGFVRLSESREKTFEKILFHPPEDLKGGKKAFREIRGHVRFLLEKALMRFLELDGLLLYYLFYNQRFFGPLESVLSVALVKAVDIHREAQEYSGVPETYWSLRAENVPNRPIAIEIHPQASQRDILAYLKHSWPDIAAMQASYLREGVLFNKTRMRKQPTKNRNRIIYENRLKPIQQIREILEEAGERAPWDDRHITRIISIERERRKRLK